MIVNVFHHQKGFLLRRISVGHGRQTDQIDARIVRRRTFAGEKDHLAGNVLRPRLHHRRRACGEKIFARHHRDENQLFLLDDTRQIHRDERIRRITGESGAVRLDWRLIGETTFDVANEQKTELKTNHNGDEKKNQRQPPCRTSNTIVQTIVAALRHEPTRIRPIGPDRRENAD